jgi:hypothetical protein
MQIKQDTAGLQIRQTGQKSVAVGKTHGDQPVDVQIQQYRIPDRFIIIDEIDRISLNHLRVPSQLH